MGVGAGGAAPAGSSGATSGAGGTGPSPAGGAGGALATGGGGAVPAGGSGGVSAAGGAGALPATGGTTATGGAAGMPAAGGAPPSPGTPSDASCTGQTLPPTTDYGARGPFNAITVNNTGPDGQYTIVRPEKLGQNGFLHPPATWGNGITTTPALYPELLKTIASHGFVVIASNNTNVTAQLMTDGLDWLLAQNDNPSEFRGHLATSCAVTIGYSLGGGAAVGAGSHPNVVTTVSFHGLQGAAENLQGPLLLFTSTSDGFVTKSGYVQPTYDRSSVVPTILATLEVPGAPADFSGHLIPLGDAGQEREPAIAWLRYWVYGDQGARHYFYGDDCVLCTSPWTDIQRKNESW